MKKSIALNFALIVLSALTCYSQKYKVINRQQTVGPAESAVHLNEAPGAGVAWLSGKHFTYGIIEFDIKGKNKPQASFVGIAFHGQNDSTYESVYFRPFNFQSNDPEKKGHAVQYIALPKYDWPVLRSQFPNKYEQPVSPVPNPNEWFHVRIEISAKTVTVYINNNPKPSLSIMSLLPLKGKMLGYWVGNGSDGDWKNIKITPANE